MNVSCVVVPVVVTEAYLVVFRRNAERFRRSALDAEHEDADADDAAADEQEALRHVHPHNSLHAAKQRQHDDCHAQDEHNRVDVDVKECRQCHRHQEEHRAGLREMAQREGERRVKTGKESEATLEVLVGRQTDDLTEQGHDDAYQRQQHDGYHQSLHQQYPVVGIGGTRVGQKRHT